MQRSPDTGAALYIASPDCITLMSATAGSQFAVATFPNVNHNGNAALSSSPSSSLGSGSSSSPSSSSPSAGCLVRYDIERSLLGPAGLPTAAEHAAFCCTRPGAQMSYLLEAPPVGVAGARLCTPPGPGAGGAIVRRPAPLVSPGAAAAFSSRHLDWSLVAATLPACTLSLVFQQTHNPDPTLPDSGFSTLYEWATHRRPRRGPAGHTLLWSVPLDIPHPHTYTNTNTNKEDDHNCTLPPPY
jgi:hypothetical protein